MIAIFDQLLQIIKFFWQTCGSLVSLTLAVVVIFIILTIAGREHS